MKYPDGEFSQVGSFIKTKFYELTAKIISERVKKGNH